MSARCGVVAGTRDAVGGVDLDPPGVWWISGADEGSLEGLMGVSDLRTSMWSDNKAGTDLLKRVIRRVG